MDATTADVYGELRTEGDHQPQRPSDVIHRRVQVCPATDPRGGKAGGPDNKENTNTNCVRGGFS